MPQPVYPPALFLHKSVLPVFCGQLGIVFPLYEQAAKYTSSSSRHGEPAPTKPRHRAKKTPQHTSRGLPSFLQKNLNAS